jgi:hypothetical protein
MKIQRRSVLAGLLGASLAPLLAGCGAPPPPKTRRRLLPLPRIQTESADQVQAAPPPPSPPAEPTPGPAFALDPEFSRAIRFFGGRVVHPRVYPVTVQGFQAYLGASGVRHFRAEELIAPNHPEVAADFGIVMLLPRREWWPRAAALSLLGEDLRRAADRYIWVRNWWRPPGYNEAVGGDPRGDHPTAHGMDFDYTSPIRRAMAERRLLQLFHRVPWLRLSLGLGRMTTHVGLFSPLGCRVWYYPEHPDHDGKSRRLQMTGLDCQARPG